MTNTYGVYLDAINARDVGVITNAYGLYAKAHSGSNLANAYGMWFEKQTV